MRSKQARAGRACRRRVTSAQYYIASRRLVRAVPIWSKAVTISFADVSRKNLFELLAQLCNRVDVGSLPVLTWTV